MEQEPKFETKAEPGHDLFRLTAEQKQKLSERIKKWQGLVRIFVHPMYEKWRGHEKKYINDPDFVKLVQIEQVLFRLLAMPENKTPPTMVMEEKECVEKLQKWLIENTPGQSQTDVYFIETLPSDSTPKVSADSVSDRNEAWKVLSDLLGELGVKKILMGGLRLEANNLIKDWTNKGPHLGSCVGIAASYLSKDKGGKFEVEMSALTDTANDRRTFVDYLKNQKSLK